MALQERVATIVDPPLPPPPPNEPRLQSARTLRSSTSFSPMVGATADLPVAPPDVPPWFDPPDTQDSSQLLLSQTQVQDGNGFLPITTTAVPALLPPETQATDDDGFVPITATRGRSTTKAAEVFLPPETVGIPQRGPQNTYAALDNASSVAIPDRHGDELRPVAGRAAASATIQAVIGKSFDDFYGPGAPTDPTTLCFKGLFDDGARMVDRILTDIHKEQKRHEAHTSQQIATLEGLELFTHGALRADVTLLKTEMEEALILLRREASAALTVLTDSMSAALTVLRRETTDTFTLFRTETVTRTEVREALQLTLNSFAGLTSSAKKLEAAVTGLSESSARATQDMLVIRQELDGGGSLADLAALARQSEQAVIGLLETSEKNAQALRDLRQELAGCAALKETVDNIKTC